MELSGSPSESQSSLSDHQVQNAFEISQFFWQSLELFYYVPPYLKSGASVLNVLEYGTNILKLFPVEDNVEPDNVKQYVHLKLS